MKIEQLERFLVVAECLNFTTAAEKLYVGQSTISRQIQALEEELGVPLLIRGSRSVELTYAGKVLQNEAARILESLDSMTAHVRAVGNGTSGMLKIATLPAPVPSLNALLRRCHEVYPNLHINYSQSSYDRLTDGLVNNDYDLGLNFSFWIPNRKEFETLDLCEDHFCILCNKDHWAAQYEESGLPIDRLKDEDFVFGRDGLYLVRHPHDFTGAPPFPPSNRYPSLEDMLIHLNISNAVALFPSVVANYLRSSLACVPITDPDLKFSLSFIWLKDNEKPSLHRYLEVARAFIKDQNA